MVAGEHYDASSCSTAASEQSGRQKQLTLNDEETSFKPYACRFCLMKFAKSQALGGHMNRHRQEREQEQVLHARRLVMQQDFPSTLLMPGQNPLLALSKPCEAPLSSFASKGSLKDGIQMGGGLPYGAASAFRNVIQPNPYNPHLGPPSHGWNLSNVAEPSQNLEAVYNLEGERVPPYQNRATYGPLISNESYIMPQLLHQAQSQHDMSLSIPYDKAMQLSMYPDDPNMPTSRRGDSLQPRQHQGEEGSFLVCPADVATNMLSSNKSLVQKNSNLKTRQAFSDVLLQSQQDNVGVTSNGFQYLGSSDRARSSLDFNVSVTNQLDGLPWMHGNIKTAVRSFNVPSADEESDHDFRIAEPKMDDGDLTVADDKQPKTMRWDLALSSQNIFDEESKMSDLVPVMGGVSAVPVDSNYDNATSREVGKRLDKTN